MKAQELRKLLSEKNRVLVEYTNGTYFVADSGLIVVAPLGTSGIKRSVVNEVIGDLVESSEGLAAVVRLLGVKVWAMPHKS